MTLRGVKDEWQKIVNCCNSIEQQLMFFVFCAHVANKEEQYGSNCNWKFFLVSAVVVVIAECALLQVLQDIVVVMYKPGAQMATDCCCC